MEFTEFQYSLGIKDDSSLTEYAFILRGLIKELFEKYGIAITKDVESYSETINGDFDVAISLTYKNLVSVSIGGYTEGSDYTVDYSNGTITLLASGDMNSDTNYTVEYTYYLILNQYNTPLDELFPTKTFKEYPEPDPDLKWAFYTSAQIRYEHLKAKTYMISSVTSPEGSKTIYRSSHLPREITSIFEHYSPLGVVSIG
jgi:hypothetical protein